jgi:hypothetical protein
MRVRDHILLTTAGAALAAPWLGGAAVGLWAGGVLLDVDHYLWFLVHHRQGGLRAAVRFFDGAHPPQTPATRALHHPVFVASVLALAARRRGLRPLAVGITFHVGLDARHEARMNRARAAALQRDHFSCQTCGARTPPLDTHLVRQPLLLPSYRPSNLMSLCGACHEMAHHVSPQAVSRWS